jgi:hypothetical protein
MSIREALVFLRLGDHPFYLIMADEHSPSLTAWPRWNTLKRGEDIGKKNKFRFEE